MNYILWQMQQEVAEFVYLRSGNVKMEKMMELTNKELLAQYPEIPWRYVMGVRDIIVHHYFDVDADEIYRICLEDIPQLQQAIKRMLDDLKTDNLIMG